jgi:hypothetical protein
MITKLEERTGLFVPYRIHNADKERIAALEAQNQRLREALEQYADKKNWNTSATVYFENPDGSEGEYEAEINEPIVWNGDGDGYFTAKAALRVPDGAAGD